MSHSEIEKEVNLSVITELFNFTNEISEALNDVLIEKFGEDAEEEVMTTSSTTAQIVTFEEVKESFIAIYGDQSTNTFTEDELEFDDAFQKAWDSVDFFEGSDADEIAEEMASFSYLSYTN